MLCTVTTKSNPTATDYVDLLREKRDACFDEMRDLADEWPDLSPSPLHGSPMSACVPPMVAARYGILYSAEAAMTQLLSVPNLSQDDAKHFLNGLCRLPVAMALGPSE